MTIERTTVHVSDDAGRIAMLEKRTVGTDDAKEVLTRYVYSNHLQSASLELDEYADIISYEEYHPYGTTAFQAKNASINAVAKRYRYTGKERDEESGLYYHGARYYIPWLCRWTAIDPMENERAGLSPYDYCSNNPVNKVDPDGMLDGWVGKADGSNDIAYNSSVKTASDATTVYGPGAKFYGERREDYVGADGNRYMLFPNGEFTKNGVRKVAPDDAKNNPLPIAATDGFLARTFTLWDDNLNSTFSHALHRYIDLTPDPTYLGEDEFGLFHGTKKQIEYRTFIHQKELGESLRNGGAFTTVGYAVGGIRGMQWGGVLDAGAAFAAGNPGVPYGKLGPNRNIQNKNISNIELSIAGPSKLPDHVASTFMGGQYKSKTLTQDAYLYRAGEYGKPLGQFFSSVAPKGILQERIDKAILPVWPGGAQSKINTGFLIRIPQGTTIYEGLVAPQGGIFVGGTPQIFINQPWNRLGVQPLSYYPLK